MKRIYVVKVGPNLYVRSRLYRIYQDTTSDISKAFFFSSKENAENVAGKAVNGEVVTCIFATDEEYNRELDILRVGYENIKKDRDDLLKELERLKRG